MSGSSSSSGSVVHHSSSSNHTSHSGSAHDVFHEAHIAHAAHPHDDRTVFVMMITLLVAAFFFHHQKRLILPFTVTMFLFGMAIGGLAHAAPSMKDYLRISNINPHLIFHIFLPVLIYEGAAALKVSVLSKVFIQAVILAGPGLIMHTCLVAIFMRFVFYSSDFGWPAAFLFGSLMSATDPVAVVAILKDLDADIAVTTLTDGEAMLNDGTAIILFQIFLPASQIGGEFEAVYTYIWRAILFTLGAYIWGKICGILLLFCMTKTHNEPVVETMVQLGFAYVAFWLADVPFQTSGVLTLVTMGVHVASNRGLCTRSLSEMNENFWEAIVFIANSVIFSLVGLIIAMEAIPNAEGADYGILIALYIMLHVFRGCMIGTLSPFLQFGRYKITLKRFALLVHGALRGGVALTLALVVYQEPSIPEAVRHKTLFLCGGIVILSIGVNGSTSKLVVGYLKLDMQPAYRIYNNKHGSKIVQLTTQEKIRELSSLPTNRKVNWPLLRQKTVGVLKKEAQQGMKNTIDLRHATNDEIFIPAISMSMKQALNHLHDDGQISSASFIFMLNLIEKKIDDNALLTPKELHDELEKNHDNWFQRVLGMLFSAYIAPAVMQCECYLSFYEIIDETKPTIMMLMSKYRSVTTYVDCIEKMKHDTLHYIHIVEQQYATITSGIGTIKNAQRSLLSAMKSIEQLEESRGFPKQQAEHMLLSVSNLMHKVSRLDPTTLPAATDDDIFRSCLLFGKCSEEQIDEILEFSKLMTVSSTEHIDLSGLRGGARPDGYEVRDVGIIVRGRVAKIDRTDGFEYAPGDWFGLHACLSGFETKSYHVNENTIYYRVDGLKLCEYIESHQALRVNLWAMVGQRLALTYFSRNYPSCHVSKQDIRQVCISGTLIFVSNDPDNETLHHNNSFVDLLSAKSFDASSPTMPLGTMSEHAVELDIGENESVFFLCGRNTEGSLVSRATRLLPICHKDTFEPGSVMFRVRNYPLLPLPMVLSKIPVLDAANIRYLQVLQCVRKGIENDRFDEAFELCVSRLVGYCQALAVTLRVLGNFKMREAKASLELDMELILSHVRNWVMGRYIRPLEPQQVEEKLMKWYKLFINNEKEWADELWSKESDAVAQLHNIHDVMSREEMDAWFSENGFLSESAASLCQSASFSQE